MAAHRKHYLSCCCENHISSVMLLRAALARCGGWAVSLLKILVSPWLQHPEGRLHWSTKKKRIAATIRGRIPPTMFFSRQQRNPRTQKRSALHNSRVQQSMCSCTTLSPFLKRCLQASQIHVLRSHLLGLLEDVLSRFVKLAVMKQ